MYDPDDDGIRGPVGETFGAALHQAGAERAFAVDYPKTIGHWVDQPWHGRGLRIRWSTFGAGGRTTGYRWITIRLTTSELGLWADPPTHDGDQILGTGLIIHPQPPTPIGVWADDPRLSADLWAFAMRVTPDADPAERESFVHLHVRNESVVWHLRASRLDPPTLIEAIDLLERVARYAETNDAALSARLGRAQGVRAHRTFEKAYVVFALGAIVAIIGGLFVLDALY